MNEKSAGMDRFIPFFREDPGHNSQRHLLAVDGVLVGLLLGGCYDCFIAVLGAEDDVSLIAPSAWCIHLLVLGDLELLQNGLHRGLGLISEGAVLKAFYRCLPLLFSSGISGLGAAWLGAS